MLPLHQGRKLAQVEGFFNPVLVVHKRNGRARPFDLHDGS
jgi:hypothetical protein